MNFNDKYQEYKILFEEQLNNKITEINSSSSALNDAVKYSLTVGGKRIRPVLMLMVADILGVDKNTVMPYALALEFIHTYSLIHDDLPAMDNDDYRRGKLTNHKVFGEAMSILAGDALLNYAYETCFRAVTNLEGINACRMLSRYAGAFGMVGGQALDISSENNNTKSLEYLKEMHDLKCGKLITIATLLPCYFKEHIFFEQLKTYGENLGLLFQITDDILDYTSNKETLGKSVLKDLNNNKLTYVNLLGLEKAKEYANKIYLNCIDAVKDVKNNEILIEFAKFVYGRNK